MPGVAAQLPPCGSGWRVQQAAGEDIEGTGGTCLVLSSDRRLQAFHTTKNDEEVAKRGHHKGS